MKNIEEKIIKYFKENYDLKEYGNINEACILFASLKYVSKINYDTAEKNLENFLENLNFSKENRDVLKFFEKS